MIWSLIIVRGFFFKKIAHLHIIPEMLIYWMTFSRTFLSLREEQFYDLLSHWTLLQRIFDFGFFWKKKCIRIVVIIMKNFSKQIEMSRAASRDVLFLRRDKFLDVHSILSKMMIFSNIWFISIFYFYFQFYENIQEKWYMLIKVIYIWMEKKYTGCPIKKYVFRKHNLQLFFVITKLISRKNSTSRL